MIRTDYKRVLLIAPMAYPNRLFTDYAHVKHISDPANIFPSIFKLNPDVIVFDLEFAGKEIENVLRRIRVNKFYNKIKIYIYKTDPNLKTDSLLKALGVDHFIYEKDLICHPKSKTVLNKVNSIIDATILKRMARVTA